MRKIVFGILVSLDGFIDHTEMIADEEIHQYAANQLDTVDAVLFGRATYQLFVDYWPTAATGSNPTLTAGELEYARKINNIPKIVFSSTLDKVEWNATLMKAVIPDEIMKMKQQPGKDLLLAGTNLASTFMKLGLIDEYEFLVQPIIIGKGTPLFKNVQDRVELKLLKTRVLNNGSVVLSYQPVKK